MYGYLTQTALKRLTAAMAVTLLLWFTGISHAASSKFVEGKDYVVLSNPEKISSDKIIVREFFWYGCPHCYHLESFAKAWKKTKPDDVAFYHTPAALNPVWEASARGLYSVQFLGKLDAVHEATFKAIQKEDQQLYSQSTLANFYSKHGVDVKKFNELYNSFAVTTKVGRSKAAAMRYQLTSVPAVVVHGKYVVKGSDAKVFETVDYLVKKVRGEGIVGK